LARVIEHKGIKQGLGVYIMWWDDIEYLDACLSYVLADIDNLALFDLINCQ